MGQQVGVCASNCSPAGYLESERLWPCERFGVKYKHPQSLAWSMRGAAYLRQNVYGVARASELQRRQGQQT